MSANRAEPAVRPLWEFRTDGPLGGLAIAREAGTLLASDTAGTLYHLGPDGRPRARWAADEPLAAAAISDDGRYVVAAAEGGALDWFDRHLRHQRTHAGPAEPSAIALDPQGWYTAVVSRTARNAIIDRFGRTVAQFAAEHPLVQVQFLLGDGSILARGEHDLVVEFDFSGRALRRWNIAGRVGSFAANSTGAVVAIAAYGRGVVWLEAPGGHPPSDVVGPASHVAMTEDGRLLLAGTTSRELVLVDQHGERIWRFACESEIVAVAIDPLGRAAFYGLEDGRIGSLPMGRG